MTEVRQSVSHDAAFLYPKSRIFAIAGRYIASLLLIFVFVLISVAIKGFPQWSFDGPFKIDPSNYPVVACSGLTGLVFFISIVIYDEMKTKSFLAVSAINGFTYNTTLLSFLGGDPSLITSGGEIIYTSNNAVAPADQAVFSLIIFIGIATFAFSIFLIMIKIFKVRSKLEKIKETTTRATQSYELGLQKGDNEALGKAISLLREVTVGLGRERLPLQWAMTQNNLGAALAALGERERSTGRLEEAIGIYRSVLEELTRRRVPLDWAATQNNLGNALASIGERQSGTASLQRAVQAYEAALLERTRERVPMDWAMTQNNLGTVLGTLGERESDNATLQRAVQAFEMALLERTRERVPMDWAMSQNNLGNVLTSLGEQESGTDSLQRAVQAYEAALLEL